MKLIMLIKIIYIIYVIFQRRCTYSNALKMKLLLTYRVTKVYVIIIYTFLIIEQMAFFVYPLFF